MIKIRYFEDRKSNRTLLIANGLRNLNTKSEMSLPSNPKDMAKSVIFTKWPTEIPEMAG